jgi:N-acylglucosamine-6-phosphate 2-epimerase
VTSADAERTQQVAEFIQKVRRHLIVSCQALPGEPMHGAEIMARMAIAAYQGGARAIRANGPADIRAIRAAVNLPIIGLFKEDMPGSPIYITPTLAHARAVAQAGANIIALDATDRPRPQPGTLADFIAAVHDETSCLIMADISTLEEGVAAQEAGADLVSTTLSGYTDHSPVQPGPDLDLVRCLAPRLQIPLIAEGRYKLPEQILQAFAFGAVSVVVGGAITRPQEITRWFVSALERNQHDAELMD